MTLAEAVGRRVKNLIEQRGLTEYGLAKLGGIPRQTINVVVKGAHSNVALDTVYQIVSTLGMSLEEFFADPLFDEVTD